MELEPFVFRHEGVLVGVREAEDLGDGDGARDGPVAAGVNAYALRRLEPGEYVVFSLDLCHNEVDRHFSRFPLEELERVNGMVPGRPLMERHDVRGSLPRGTFFRSELHRDGERVSVRPDVYVLRTRENEAFILNIEGGVYRETSMGFSFRLPECSVCGRDLRRCDHMPGRSYGDEVCHYVMRDVLEVIEGSVVPAGSQGTGFVAGTRGDERGLCVGLALEAARRAYHRPIDLWSERVWCEE